MIGWMPLGERGRIACLLAFFVGNRARNFPETVPYGYLAFLKESGKAGEVFQKSSGLDLKIPEKVWLSS